MGTTDTPDYADIGCYYDDCIAPYYEGRVHIHDDGFEVDDDYLEPDLDNYDPVYDYKYYDGTG